MYKIENIIKNEALKMKHNPQISDYDIVKFIHIELGKIIYYDNNYSAKLNDEKSETELSINRKSNLLKKHTDKLQPAQICKGMAEIVAEILNEIGIEARAVGVEKKGDIQEVPENIAKHYYVKFKVGEQDYVQDYLMESALMRIKIGEAELAERIPGICHIEEYPDCGVKSLAQTELSYDYLEDFFEKKIDNLNDIDRLNLIFQKLNEFFDKENTSFGFEESKDFVFLIGKTLIKDKSKIKFINLVKESKNECGVACIYEFGGKKFLVRGKDETTDISFKPGKISNDNLYEILKQGYEGRSPDERNYLQSLRENAEICKQTAKVENGYMVVSPKAMIRELSKDKEKDGEYRMCSKECFHFTNLDRLSSIKQYGLIPRLEDNSKAVKDTAPKVSFSDGRYAAAGLMADFYQVYCSIKNGTRDKSKTDLDLEKRVLLSSSFEDFLGDGMYLIFDGSDIKNTGGNNGHINSFDAGTTQTINPEKLKVCVLKDVETGETSYSKYEYAFYLMANLTENDKRRLGSELLKEIKQFQQDHLEIAEKFSKHSFSEEIISMDEFQEIIKNKEGKKISIEEAVRNAITQGIATEDIKRVESLERTNDKNISEVSKDG